MPAGMGIAVAGLGLLLFALLMATLSTGGVAFFVGLIGVALTVAGGFVAEFDRRTA
jgi:hypothetical protein